MAVLRSMVYSLLAAGVVHGVPSKRQDKDDNSRFTFYTLTTPASGPCDLATGPDGALWGQSILVDHIFRIDPSTGQIQEYPIPFTTPLSNTTLPIPDPLNLLTDRTALSCAIRAGADGNLYAANGLRNQLVRIDPNTRAIKIYTPTGSNPAGNLQPFNDLYTATDGIWLTETTGNTFQFFSFATEQFTTYPVPTPLSLPLGVFVASSGVVYVAELLANKILTYDPKTAELEEYPIAMPGAWPAVIRAEWDGWVYFSLLTGDGVGRIGMEDGKIETFRTNQLGGLGSEVTIDGKHGVWLSFFGTANVLARFDTGRLEFDYVAIPGTTAEVIGSGIGAGIVGDVPPSVDVAINYGPGDAVWFTSVPRNAAGRYDLKGLF